MSNHDYEKMTGEETMLFAAEQLLQLENMPGWKILLAQLHNEALDAKDELATTDPFEPQEIMRLQNKIFRLEWIESTLQELIRQGIQPEIIEEEGLPEGDGDTSPND